jgi:tRNA threonylcarbamoyladenosine biosynthesis protein TsaE
MDDVGTVIVENIEELERFAHDFLHDLKPRTEGATVVGLSGELGAGKTTFVQCLARVLGVEERVTSPTFVIEKIYQLREMPFSRLIHVDAYRLESGRELNALGFLAVAADPCNLIVIEWPERVRDALPAHTVALNFQYQSETTRIIKM